MMGTEILRIDAEMAEKIEVGVGTFTTEMNLHLSDLPRSTLRPSLSLSFTMKNTI